MTEQHLKCHQCPNLTFANVSHLFAHSAKTLHAISMVNDVPDWLVAPPAPMPQASPPPPSSGSAIVAELRSSPQADPSSTPSPRKAVEPSNQMTTSAQLPLEANTASRGNDPVVGSPTSTHKGIEAPTQSGAVGGHSSKPVRGSSEGVSESAVTREDVEGFASGGKVIGKQTVGDGKQGGPRDILWVEPQEQDDDDDED